MAQDDGKDMKGKGKRHGKDSKNKNGNGKRGEMMAKT